MHSEHSLTVRDVLQRPLFAKAQIVAGKEGVGRSIRWVHILEVTSFETLIHGEEMILSTGVGLQKGRFSETYYLKKLIEQGASCLCLELGDYIRGINEEMIRIADENHFPLIAFQEVVRFVDITQDLHSLLINRHHQMLQMLDAISKKFNEFTLSSPGSQHILKLLHSSTGAQVAYIPMQGQAQFVPALKKESRARVKQKLLSHYYNECQRQKSNTVLQWTDPDSGKQCLLQVIEGMGQTWAVLVLMFDNRIQQEFDVLVLDRAAIALAQDLLRRLYTEEHKLHSEHVWVDDLIHQRIHSEKQAVDLLEATYGYVQNLRFCVCIIKMIHSHEQSKKFAVDELESIRFQIAVLVRNIFKKHNFHPFMTTKRNHLIILAMNTKPETTPKEHLREIFNSLERSKPDQGHPLQLTFGVGRPYAMLTDAHLSYNEAQQVLHLNDLNLNKVSPFYQDIGIYQLLLNIEDQEVTQSFIVDYIGPLIEHDRTKNGELLQTLKVYLQHNCSKHTSAQKLHIARQTLYHRLAKINGLLGVDCTSPDQRLPIEVAIMAYELTRNPDSKHVK